MNHRFPSVSTEVRQPSLAQLDLENPEATFSHAFSRSKYRRDPKVTVTMDSGPMNAVLSGAGLLVDDDKATNEMRKSISKFATLLTCPLCNKVRSMQYRQHFDLNRLTAQAVVVHSPSRRGSIVPSMRQTLPQKLFFLSTDIVLTSSILFLCSSNSFIPQQIFDRPATLSACGHTFCMNCIDAYSSNNCECPGKKNYVLVGCLLDIQQWFLTNRFPI